MNAASTNIKMDIINKSAESRTMCSNFFVLKSCRITATDIMPPARPAVKYARISNMPCAMYLKIPNENI